MTVPLAIWLARYEVGSWWKWWAIQPDSRVRRIRFAVAWGVACAIRDGGVGADQCPSKNAIAGGVRCRDRLPVRDCPPARLLERFQQMRLGRGGKWSGRVNRERIELARAGMRMIEAHPVFGIGWVSSR